MEIFACPSYSCTLAMPYLSRYEDMTIAAWSAPSHQTGSVGVSNSEMWEDVLHLIVAKLPSHSLT